MGRYSSNIIILDNYLEIKASAGIIIYSDFAGNISVENNELRSKDSAYGIYFSGFEFRFVDQYGVTGNINIIGNRFYHEGNKQYAILLSDINNTKVNNNYLFGPTSGLGNRGIYFIDARKNFWGTVPAANTPKRNKQIFLGIDYIYDFDDDQKIGKVYICPFLDENGDETECEDSNLIDDQKDFNITITNPKLNETVRQSHFYVRANVSSSSVCYFYADEMNGNDLYSSLYHGTEMPGNSLIINIPRNITKPHNVKAYVLCYSYTSVRVAKSTFFTNLTENDTIAAFDSDNDGTPDIIDSCNEVFGKDCNGCPSITCDGQCVEISESCPSTGPRQCINSNTDRLCDLRLRCSNGFGDNQYGSGSAYACKGYCDGFGSCDYANYCMNPDFCVVNSTTRKNTLDGFPENFASTTRSERRPMILFGQNASPQNVVAGVDIATQLEFSYKTLIRYLFSNGTMVIGYEKPILYYKFPFFSEQNITPAGNDSIIIGEPCTNPLIPQYLGAASCQAVDFKGGVAIVKLIHKSADDTLHLLIVGKDPMATRAAARLVTKSASSLSGTTVYLASYSSDFSTLSVGVCGDALCNNEETCSSCASDCGSCPSSSGSSGGGGGGGGGGGYYTPPTQPPIAVVNATPPPPVVTKNTSATQTVAEPQGAQEQSAPKQENSTTDNGTATAPSITGLSTAGSAAKPQPIVSWGIGLVAIGIGALVIFKARKKIPLLKKYGLK